MPPACGRGWRETRRRCKWCAEERADSTDLSAELERDEAAAAVRAAVAELPAPLREAVILFEYQQKSHAEIAEILGATPKAVETRLYRAREALRQRLRRWLEGPVGGG